MATTQQINKQVSLIREALEMGISPATILTWDIKYLTKAQISNVIKYHQENVTQI